MSSANLMTVPWASEANRASDANPPVTSDNAPALTEGPPAERPLSSSPVPTEVRSPAEMEGDADEIEKYFASLMQRVGGAPKPAAPTPAPLAPQPQVSSKAAPSPAVTQVSPPRSSDPAKPSVALGAAAAAELTTPPAPKELPRPRAAAAEMKVDLQVLRDVANVHRQGAIDRFDCQSLFRRAYGVWLFGAMMGALSLSFSLFPAASVLQFMASLAAFAASVVCTFAYWRMAQRHRRQVDSMLAEGLHLLEGAPSVDSKATPPSQEPDRA